jgi:hypothetical protein
MKIKIKSYPKEIHPFIIFVKKLYKINKWNDIDKLEIILDYQAKNVAGYYFPNQKNKLYINPTLCISHVLNTEFSEPIILIHELAHLLDNHFNMFQDWSQKFPQTIINHNSGRNRTEELAELLTVYLINHKSLKQLNNNMYKYFRNMIKPPNKSNINLPENITETIANLTKQEPFKL